MIADRSTQRILLCDDELPILRATEFKLVRAGFQVQCAGDGQAAWEAIQHCPPDLLITDFQMPRLNGLKLIQQVRSCPATALMPIILLTAKGLELADDDVLRQLRLLAVVSKPFSPRELLHLVESTFLEQHASVDPH